MAWIEVHQALFTHRKTMELADLLGIQPINAAAHVISLWAWSLDNAPDGALNVRCTIIARACTWSGDANALVQALIESGFLDTDETGNITIHDWDDYAGRLVDKRRANAERMRKARQNERVSNKEESATHVQRTLRARAGATVPNSTVPNTTKPKIVKPAAEASDGGETVLDFETFFEDLWRRYPVREGSGKIGKAETKVLVRNLSPPDWPDVLKAVTNYAASGRMPVDPIRFFKSKEYPLGFWRQFVNVSKANGNTGGNGHDQRIRVGERHIEQNGKTTGDGRRLLTIDEALAQHIAKTQGS